jgi:hypothetical protein
MVKRGTPRTKKTNTRKVADEVVKTSATAVAGSYLATDDLVPVADFAKVAGISKKELVTALEDKGVTFYTYDMLQKIPCSPEFKGDVYAEVQS